MTNLESYVLNTIHNKKMYLHHLKMYLYYLFTSYSYFCKLCDSYLKGIFTDN